MTAKVLDLKFYGLVDKLIINRNYTPLVIFNIYCKIRSNRITHLYQVNSMKIIIDKRKSTKIFILKKNNPANYLITVQNIKDKKRLPNSDHRQVCNLKSIQLIFWEKYYYF